MQILGTHFARGSGQKVWNRVQEFGGYPDTGCFWDFPTGKPCSLVAGMGSLWDLFCQTGCIGKIRKEENHQKSSSVVSCAKIQFSCCLGNVSQQYQSQLKSAFHGWMWRGSQEVEYLDPCTSADCLILWLVCLQQHFLIWLMGISFPDDLGEPACWALIHWKKHTQTFGTS